MNIVEQPTLATEAIRAFFTLQCCWLNNEEIYLEKGCLHCGSAATYLIYFTNTPIQNLLLNFIQKYNCHHSRKLDLLDLLDFEEQYNDFLQILENAVNSYACQYQNRPRALTFEQVDSIFEREAAVAC